MGRKHKVEETALWTTTAGGVSPASAVRLLDHTWGHIVKNHPDMTPLFNEIRNAVAAPTTIYTSATQPNDSVLFFDENVIDSATGQVLAVPVLLTKGIVTTACYRNVNYSGTLLWRR